MARLGIVSLRRASPAAAAAVTGLTFPINNNASVPRFVFTGADLIPMYPLTLIQRVYILQQTGYHTTFFWGNHESPFVANRDYFGCHPYPVGPDHAAGTDHNWEISALGADAIVDENAYDTTVTKGRWYTQATTAELVGGLLQVRFYYDLDAGIDRVIEVNWDAAVEIPNSPGLFYGGNPWAELTEHLGGHLRGIQQYAAKLSAADIQTEAANHSVNTPQTAGGLSSVWYMNQNPTHTDISDKSGQGHDPAWVGADRPTTYTE
jgi:hypothetical protein